MADAGDEKIARVKEILDDAKNNKKYDALKAKLEALLESKIQIELLLDDSAGNEPGEFGDIMSGGGDAEEIKYWNYYGATMKELMENGFSVEDSTIYIVGEFTDAMAADFDLKLKVLEKLGSEDGTITVYIHSPGGSAYSLISMLESVRLCVKPVQIICKGIAMSAAATFLMCGTKGLRKATRNSNIMIHDLSTGIGGTYKDIMTEANHIKDLQQQCYNILAENTAKDSEWWEANLQRDMYLTAQQCLELGIIDEII